ncbi:LOW QUALITY PROTEIN: hypothetical protein PFAG_05466 [Plasmodium falciparum Santa Lucia]|uniref:Uncharacterized protein n=2 Tax=Plasmodium falciparum TaxID=5833 RepID=A0A024VZ25_PLAFA|nr:LOW QUALITY PROTEIN: hypothetical protein PFTANZ_05353 [Plasmodium falciparum Tanzania (2000708)]EUT78889.1 LOW QUALITY PROTEIN: hypothetical protein PFAG_05466 [Plasmodium falciparum Santa Lucia]
MIFRHTNIYIYVFMKNKKFKRLYFFLSYQIILLEYYNLNIIENIVLFYIYVLFMKKKVEEYFNTNNYIKVIISLNGYININNYSNKEKQAGFLFIFL